MQLKSTPEPVRTAHILAVLLIAAFVAQCAWFISHVPLTSLEANYILQGLGTVRQLAVGQDPMRSPMIALLSIAGIGFRQPSGGLVLDQFWLDQHRWFVRAPFLLAGVLLAASLWFVARRLYGNAGGYLALALYAFSPGLIARSGLAGPEIFGAWGSFGLVFTAIATAHTLYAPREVILWNWKRIALLGIAIVMAIGSQWALAWVLVPALAFMLWAVPHRRGAAALIFVSACFVAFVLMDVVYLAHIGAFARGVRDANWFGLAPIGIPFGAASRLLASYYFDASPAALLLFPVAVVAYVLSRRSRFFGNTAPLILFVMLFLMGILLPHSGGAIFFFYSVPFLLLFIAGVFADLFQSGRNVPALALSWAVVAAQAAYSIASLMRMYSRTPTS